MSVSVRNPLKRRTVVLIGVKGVPDGFSVHFPDAWVWLEPLEERRFELLIIPLFDYTWYKDRRVPHANVRLEGDIPRTYLQEILPAVLPGSRFFSIGGVTCQVTPKKAVDIKIEEDREQSKKTIIAIRGVLSEQIADEIVRIDLTDPDGVLHIMEINTNVQGGFTAIFDISNVRTYSGVYKIRAFTINSPNAAQAESNIVYVKR
jgi:hypothetical protein